MRSRMMFAALAMTAAVPAMAQTADWRTVGTFGEGDTGSLMMVNAASLRQAAGGLREITISSYFAQQKSFSSGMTYDSIGISYRIDCAAGTYQTFQSVAYAGETAILTSDTLKEMAPFKTGTVVAAIAPSVCSGSFANLAKITSATPNLAGKAKYNR